MMYKSQRKKIDPYDCMGLRSKVTYLKMFYKSKI